MAIGNPFGLGGSVSVGIISAKQRDINSGPYDDFLQTDAAINKGNSGGPLFNMDGDVVGVNTAIISPTGGSIGIGFSVPSDIAVNVIDQLRKYGETRRGWLGVKIQSVTSDLAETLGLEKQRGALVANVTQDSPAAVGGLLPGDVILKFNDKDVGSMRSLPRVVARTPIGKAVDVEVIRKGEKKVLQIEVGRLQEGRKTPPPRPETERAPAPKERELLGLKLSSLTGALRKKFRLGKDVKGVVVIEVDPTGPAARKNIKVGDVIVEAGQASVFSLNDLAESIKKVEQSGRRAILLRVEDAQGDLRFVAVLLKK